MGTDDRGMHFRAVVGMALMTGVYTLMTMEEWVLMLSVVLLV